MSSNLLAQFNTLCSRALRTPPERNLDPSIEALGYAVWLAAIGDADTIPKSAAVQLERIGLRVLEAIDTGPPKDSSDPDEDVEDRAAVNATLKSIVYGGIAACSRSGKTHAAGQLFTRLHPPPATLTRLLSGKADGLTAGRYGLHVAACTSCQREVAILRASSATESAASADRVAESQPLRLAAAEVASVRAPSEGAVIARWQKPVLEAVLFNDADARRLGIYSDKRVWFSVVAEGATTEDTLQGYWLGKLDPKMRDIRALIEFGDKRLTWNIATLPAKVAKTHSRQQRAPKVPTRRKPKPRAKKKR